MTSMYWLAPEDEGPVVKLPRLLAKLVGATPASGDHLMEAFKQFLKASNPAVRKIELLEVKRPGPDRLLEIGEHIKSQIDKEGLAMVDLDGRLIGLSELLEAALCLGLNLELVAVLKPGPGSTSLADPYRKVLDAMRALGGQRLSTSQIAARLKVRPERLRRWLNLLVHWQRIVRTGEKGGSRYSLGSEE